MQTLKERCGARVWCVGAHGASRAVEIVLSRESGGQQPCTNRPFWQGCMYISLSRGSVMTVAVVSLRDQGHQCPLWHRPLRSTLWTLQGTWPWKCLGARLYHVGRWSPQRQRLQGNFAEHATAGHDATAMWLTGSPHPASLLLRRLNVAAKPISPVILSAQLFSLSCCSLCQYGVIGHSESFQALSFVDSCPISMFWQRMKLCIPYSIIFLTLATSLSLCLWIVVICL